MRKLLVIVITIVLIVSVIRSNAFCVNDRIVKFIFTHSTVLGKDIVEYDITSVGGEAYSVGIDTMGTTTPEDDIIVWTIKK